MTTRLYYDDAYSTRFTATVVAVETDADGRPGLVLDRTLFYPTSGGQMHDLGRLAGVEVVDVMDEESRIVHVLAAAVPVAVGDAVEGEIDAERRRRHRQQHTGQHVLSRIIEERLGLPTVSSRLGETGNTLDLEVPALEATTLREIEDETNRRLWEGRPVHVRYLDENEASRMGLRKKLERAGPLRVIEVEGVDRCPCGGTHTRNTAEVGLVALTATEKVRGGTRIHFLCGDDALAHRRTSQERLARVALTLTSGPDQVEDLVTALLRETKERQKRITALARELVALRAAAWPAEAPTVRVDGRPVRLVLRRLDADEALASSEAMHVLTTHPDVLAVLLLESEEKGQLLLGRGEEVGVDCDALLRAALAPVGGRGGGKPQHARGGYPGGRADTVIDALRSALGII